jgi:hypothetical protein
MITVSEKELKAPKKPIQVYFDQDTLSAVQEKLKKSEEKLTMSDYVRELVEKDLGKKKHKERKWVSVSLGLNLASDSREIDKIAYGI